VTTFREKHKTQARQR